MKAFSLKNDNKGFSLVELIVVVLVTSILMLAIMLFISSSRSVYQSVNTSATLQEEAINLERVVSEYLQEAVDYGFNSSIIVAGKDTSILWIKALENENVDNDPAKKYSYYYFVFDKGSGKLKFYKDQYNSNALVGGTGEVNDSSSVLANACFGDNEKYSIISNRIKSIEYTTQTRADGKNLICLTVTYTYVGKEYTSHITTVTRNKKVSTTDEGGTDEGGTDEGGTDE